MSRQHSPHAFQSHSHNSGYHDNALGSRHLHLEISIVWHRHELGQSRISEDCIVGQTDVGDVKVDELDAVVVALPEGDWKANLPYWNSGTISDS